MSHTYNSKGNHIITSQIEHPAILNPCKYLEGLGYEISYVPVDQYGLVNPSDIENLITSKTILVTIMHSNNETGTIQYIEEISKICKKHQVLLHTDASQSIGKIVMDVKSLGVDFLTVAGHEGGRRAGTENIILEVGPGKACEISIDAMKNSEVKELTDYFYERLKEKFGNKIHYNGR